MFSRMGIDHIWIGRHEGTYCPRLRRWANLVLDPAKVQRWSIPFGNLGWDVTPPRFTLAVAWRHEPGDFPRSGGSEMSKMRTPALNQVIATMLGFAAPGCSQQLVLWEPKRPRARQKSL